MESTQDKKKRDIFTHNLWLSFFIHCFKDPQSNVIFQWINVTTFRNITQLSFQLTLEPILGDYTIVIKTQSGMTVMDHFTVNRDGNQVLFLILLLTSSKQQNAMV